MRVRVQPAFAHLLVAVLALTGAAQTPRSAGSSAKAVSAPSDASRDDAQDALELDANLVLVSAVVTKGGEDGKPLRGLTARDFSVADEGVPQQVAFFGDETLPLDVEFLFDASDSMQFREAFQRAALASFLRGLLRPGDRASILSFENRVRVEQDFTSDAEALLAAIDRLPSGGATALYDAIVMASDRMANERGRRAIVVFSDGYDTFSNARLETVLKRAQGADVSLYAINTSRPAWSVTDAFKQNDPLEFLASETGGEVYYPGDAKAVLKTLAVLSSHLRERYVLGFYPSVQARDGRFRRLTVTVAHKKASVRARTGYYAPDKSAAKSSQPTPRQ
jgi:Ca-activated chloride channel homolog